MSCGSIWLRAGLLMAVLCQSCTTAVLWDWAGQRETPGQLAGVVRDGNGGDIVVYQFDGSGEFSGDTLGVRIPPDWHDQPLRVLAVSPGGDALALAQPLVPMAGVPLPREPGLSLRLIDYKNTIGRQLLVFLPGERPLGYVPLMDDADRVLHELYGYHRDRGQWVRLATVNLGAFEMDGGRVATGVVLTPVTMVLDLAMLLVLVCAAGEEGNVSGLEFPAPGSGPPNPIRVAARDRYWHSLITPALPAGR